MSAMSNGSQQSMGNDKAPLIFCDKVPLMGHDSAHHLVNLLTKKSISTNLLDIVPNKGPVGVC